MAYRFEWDETKNGQNIKKHGFDFADAEEMFRGILFAAPDMREDYGENRWVGVGTTRGRTAVVAFAERGEQTIRIISLRKEIVVRKRVTKKRSGTNWKRVDALKDSEIDFSDVGELDRVFFARAVRWPGRKQQITLRLDPDVLAFFRQSGRGYQTAINTVLRRYMEAQQ